MATRVKICLFAWCAMWALTHLGVPEAFAAPPAVRGIDLPTVLSLADRARHAEHVLTPDAPGRAFDNIRTIVLDPGHGGENEGALGVAHVLEKYLTLELAYRLREELQKRYPGTRVVLTRYWDADVGLSDRIKFANILEADVFISLHYNAAVHNRAVGYETYFLTTEEATPGASQVEGDPIATAELQVTGIDREVEPKPESGTYNDAVVRMQRDLRRQRQHEESGLLARTIQGRLGQVLESIDRGVKQANFAVLRGALMPAVVVEAGFLTHPEEGKACSRKSHREKVVQALVRALEDFDQKLGAKDGSRS